jgi:pantothenate kinase
MSSSENNNNDSMSTVYDRLTSQLEDCSRNGSHQQYWVGVGGGGGAGKTTVARAIADRLNDRGIRTVVVPMDGFHLTQKRLTEEYGEDAMLRRGAPFSFDSKGLCEALKKAKQEHKAEFPEYDRNISDPVPSRIKVTPEDSIIMVEGLYLLHEKDPDWAPLQDLWDEKWWVKAPTLDIQKERLVNRSLKTWTDVKAKQWGPGKEGATKRAQTNDFKNLDLIAYCEEVADEVIVTV